MLENHKLYLPRNYTITLNGWLEKCASVCRLNWLLHALG